MAISKADGEAVERLLGVAPAWTGLRTAADAVGLEARTLLHAGPPARPEPPSLPSGRRVVGPGGRGEGPPVGEGATLVRPIRNSAAVACVFEGWAADVAEGAALVESGAVRIVPAQDRSVAVPMAAVVSPSMALIEVADLARPEGHAFAPINGGGHGGFPALRYGRLVPEAVDHLRWINGPVAEILAAGATEPLPLLPILDGALEAGDDGHLRHVAAAGEFSGALAHRLGARFAGGPVEAFIAEWPIFFLAFSMAAMRCLLDGARGVAGASLCTAFGGNGARFGIELAGLPGRWFTAEAGPPAGKLRTPYRPEDCLGAIGDSALVEAFGLGALARSYCPAMQELHAGFSPPDTAEIPAKLLAAAHPGLARSGARVGLLARRIVETRTTPVIELGIIDTPGEAGGLGAGMYRPPLGVFEDALAALEAAG